MAPDIIQADYEPRRPQHDASEGSPGDRNLEDSTARDGTVELWSPLYFDDHIEQVEVSRSLRLGTL